MRFVLPHSPDDRPGLARAARPVPLRPSRRPQEAAGNAHARPAPRPEGAPILDEYTRGFEYSDCWVDDARLVVLNALGAAREGRRGPDPHRLHQRAAGGRGLDRRSCATSAPAQCGRVRARAIVNAAGPWVNDIIGRVAGLEQPPQRAPGQGQPHHRAEILGGPARLSGPEPRQARDLHQSLRGRSRADRHDRHRL